VAGADDKDVASTSKPAAAGGIEGFAKPRTNAVDVTTEATLEH
jgi:hypothetical protein